MRRWQRGPVRHFTRPAPAGMHTAAGRALGLAWHAANALWSALRFWLRKTSMRDRNAWSQLQLGDMVEFSWRVCAGRGIISDAIKSAPA